MKNSHISLSMLLSFFLLCCTLVGCVKEEVSKRETESAEISLQLPNTELRGGELFAGDAKVTMLRVLIFKGMALDVQKVFQGGDLASTLRMKASVGSERRVVVIANEPDAISGALDMVVFYADLSQIKMPEITSSPTIPLVMVGSKDDVTISEAGISNVRVSLERVVAKITLDVEQRTPNTTDRVEVKAVNIVRNAKVSSLIPLNEPVDINKLWIWDLPNLSKHLINNADPISLITDGVLYVYENLGSSATDTLGRAPILTLKALYNDIESHYKAYINDNGEHQYQLKRNHHYRLKATITKIGEYEGMLLTTSVLPWEVEKLSHKVRKPYLVSISPANLITAEQTIRKDSPITVTLCIKGEEGEQWKATISDGLHFEITGDRQGVADGITSYTFQINALDEGGESVRQAEVYFTINGTHVLAAENSSEYAKIQIKQPIK